MAAPVAAKEAAVAMGLNPSLGGASIGVAPTPMLTSPASIGSQLADWVTRMRDLDRLSARDEMRQQMRGGMTLDPDIAAMRAISPAMARAMQTERNIDRALASERNWIQREIDRLMAAK